MPTFEKIKLHNVPQKGDIEQWILKIDNKHDLDRYHKLDAELNMRSFLSMERRGNRLAFDHLGALPGRDMSLNAQIKLACEALKEGEKAYPILEVAKITDRKYLSMLKAITRSGAIRVNHSGGFCDYDDYIKTWDAKILESITKNDFGFPLDDEALTAKTIILENAHQEFVGGRNYLIKQIGIENAGSVSAIYNLKEIDRTYIFKCLSNAENIIIPTEAQDAEQLSAFMKMFLTLKPKNIYVR